MTNLVKLFTHPEYDENIGLWEEYYDLWNGDHDVMRGSKYLWRHILEKGRDSQVRELRLMREERSQYTNYIAPLEDIRMGMFFQKEPTLDEETSRLLGEEINDIDGSGLTIFSFLKTLVHRMDFLYGRVFILIDAHDVRPRSQAEAEQVGLRPFFEILDPRFVKDWARDSDGKLRFLRYEYTQIEPRGHPQDEILIRRYSRSLILDDNDNYFVELHRLHNNDEIEVVGNRPAESQWEPLGDPILIQGINEIPVVMCRNCESWIKHVAPQQKRHHNIESSLDNGLYNQAHQRLYATGVDIADKSQIKAMTEYTMLLFKEGVTVDAIEPSRPDALIGRLSETRNAIFRIGTRLMRQLNDTSKGVQSANTLREEKESQISIIKARIKDYEDMTNEAIGWYARFKGIENFQGKISFNTDISNADVELSIKMFLAMKDELGQLPETKKQFVKGILQDAPIEDRDKAITEIDDFNFQSTNDAGTQVRPNLRALINGNINGSGESTTPPR